MSFPTSMMRCVCWSRHTKVAECLAQTRLLRIHQRQRKWHRCCLEHRPEGPGATSLDGAARVGPVLGSVLDFEKAGRMAFGAEPGLMSDLTYAGNDGEALTTHARATLLRRAAETIREFRRPAKGAEPPECSPLHGDIVLDLIIMASAIELFSPETISAKMLEAADMVKTYTSDGGSHFS